MKYLLKPEVTLSIILLLTITISCKKDNENPTITVNSPEQHTHFNWGEMVPIKATFEDDQGLKSYKAMIVDADGNHLNAFNFMKSGNISGVSYEFNEYFEVPNDVPMMAWVQFTLTDTEDKMATTAWMLHFDD